ncbi:hypothetical protein, partial [Enterobacter hormaechei]
LRERAGVRVSSGGRKQNTAQTPPRKSLILDKYMFVTRAHHPPAPQGLIRGVFFVNKSELKTQQKKKK